MLLAYSHFLWLYDGDYILQSCLYSFTISYKKYFDKKNIYKCNLCEEHLICQYSQQDACEVLRRSVTKEDFSSSPKPKDITAGYPISIMKATLHSKICSSLSGSQNYQEICSHTKYFERQGRSWKPSHTLTCQWERHHYLWTSERCWMHCLSHCQCSSLASNIGRSVKVMKNIYHWEWWLKTQVGSFKIAHPPPQ